MDFLKDTWTLFQRHFRATLRNPAFVIISIVQPVLWLFLFGQLFSRVAAQPGAGGASYAQFLAPGIAIMAALFGTAFSGVGGGIGVTALFITSAIATIGSTPPHGREPCVCRPLTVSVKRSDAAISGPLRVGTMARWAAGRVLRSDNLQTLSDDDPFGR